MKVCLVHDDFLQVGGAESLFEAIANFYPKAPIYTSLVDWQKIPKSITKDRIKTSWVQKIPFAKHFYKALLPLYPFAFESFDLSKYDLVISSTTRFAKAVITRPETVHVSYVNTTPRFLWSKKSAFQYLPKLLNLLVKPIMHHLKKWDKMSSSRADFYLANSQNVNQRLKKNYSRNSKVIYPFADTSYFKPAKIHNWPLKNKKYYLVVSRLVKWKKIDLAIKATSQLNKNLIIVGDGPDANRLKNLARSQNTGVDFKRKVSNQELKELYNNCVAMIITQEEDFGIAAIESQSCGKPVIAYYGGGLKEIITESKTGLFFNEQSTHSLKDAIQKQAKLKWSEKQIRINALRFSKRKFEDNFIKTIEDYVKAGSRY